MTNFTELSKKAIKENLFKLPYLRGMYKNLENFTRLSKFQAGHFYSPIVSLDEIKQREEAIWSGVQKKEITGIELNDEKQVQLFSELSQYFGEIPFTMEKVEGKRYHLDNEFYPFIDGLYLFSMIRRFNPKRIVEMGSGFSSALMLDVNDIFYNKSIELTFIEPNPERLYSLISEADRHHVAIHDKMVQEVDLDIFKQLQAGDFLFIDSSHVCKTGSDVNYILFEVLPLIKPGVLIHFHDIFYPFEYVKEWVYEGRSWNENYILKAFLMYNKHFEIRLFAHYLHMHHPDLLKTVPFPFKYLGVNLWLEKK